MKNFRIVLYQKPLGINISHNDTAEMRRYRPHFICFPEYFFSNISLGNQGQTEHNQKREIQRIETISRELDTVVIGGSMPERAGDCVYNTCFVYDRGRYIGKYRKKNLFFPEKGKITPGKQFEVFSAYGITFGVLICADVFYDNSFEFMRDHGAKIIFSPTFSLKKEETIEDKFKRDREIYVRGAAIADAVIVKVCGVKSDFKNFLQARSLIADKNRVIYRVQPEEEDTAMIIKQGITIP